MENALPIFLLAIAAILAIALEARSECHVEDGPQELEEDEATDWLWPDGERRQAETHLGKTRLGER